MIMKKNEIEKENIIPSLIEEKWYLSNPCSICSSNVKAIQELIGTPKASKKIKKLKFLFNRACSIKIQYMTLKTIMPIKLLFPHFVIRPNHTAIISANHHRSKNRS